MTYQTIFLLLALVALCIFTIVISINISINSKKNVENKESQKGIINKLNHSEFVSFWGKKAYNPNLVKIFNRAKNPWGLTIATFQFIRYAGIALFSILALIFFIAGIDVKVVFLTLGLGLICFFYPSYYYKAIGDEREAEWNKMYEFIWVIKHNIMLYDPAKSFLNTKLYIAEHAPHNKELISGFNDFYKYWNTNEIDPYIERYYSFSVTREITQIMFNMSKTGEFPEDSMNSLRAFIINSQNLTVEKTLSGVSGKATVFSLPFLMISVIIALMVPLVMELLNFL